MVPGIANSFAGYAGLVNYRNTASYGRLSAASANTSASSPASLSANSDDADVRTVAQAKVKGYSQGEIRQKEQSGEIECETCKERKYKDGSDENVSYKSATHISPESAASAVKAHEQEHVSNAYEKAEQNGGKVLSVNVQIHTAQCPECGRTYVSGGETTSRIAYSSDNQTSESGLGSLFDAYA